MRAGRGIIVGVLLIALAVPTIAYGTASIYEGRGVARGRLGMSYTQLRAALGKPTTSGRDTRYTGMTVYYYCYGHKTSSGLYPLKVYRKATVFTFEVNTTGYITTKSIGVGSRESYLKSRYGSALKRYPGSVYTRYQYNSNSHHTDFYVKSGYVRKIVVRS